MTLALIGLMSCGKQPTSNFTWEPQDPIAGEEVQFTNKSLNAERYSWNLGNMKISSDENPKNIYETAGDYIIDLRVYNGSKSDEKTVTISVSP
ncbi:MAG: PKD domain-containing protein [Cryomorphaceae bacterium]|nr:PKD domain-containing protein [Flavobacteriales bacterium]